MQNLLLNEKFTTQTVFNESENEPIAIIDCGALKRNAKAIKKLLNSPFYAVVKSDAYGHGLIECARAVEDYCDGFAVGFVEEGVRLRLAGIFKPILCLLPPKNIFHAVMHDLEFAVHTVEYATTVANFCKERNLIAKVHIAVNSGMNRLGVDSVDDLKQILNLNSINFKIVGLFSHLYNGENYNSSKQQLEKFLPFANECKRVNEKILLHIGASSALNLGREFWLDFIRVGIAMYGYSAINGTLQLEKVMKVFANKLQTRKINSGANLLYGDYKLLKNSSVTIYGYGYANGLRRNIKGALNCACMNLCAFEGMSDCVLIMSDANLQAKAENTIPYEILTRYGLNCKKIYLDGDKNESNIR